MHTITSQWYSRRANGRAGYWANFWSEDEQGQMRFDCVAVMREARGPGWTTDTSWAAHGMGVTVHAASRDAAVVAWLRARDNRAAYQARIGGPTL